MLIADLIKDHAKKKKENVEYGLVSHNDPKIHAEQNGNQERHKVSKDLGSCAMPKMPEILKTMRNIFRLWFHVAGYHRRGQDAGRATNRQSIQHVRP